MLHRPALTFLLLALFSLHARAADISTALKQLDSRSPEQALPTLRSLAELGSPNAQRALGEALANGTGTAKDEVTALGWLLAARENGSSESVPMIADLEPRLSAAQLAQAREHGTRYGKTFAKGLEPADGAHVAALMATATPAQRLYATHLYERMIKAADKYKWMQSSFTYILDESGQVRDLFVSDIQPNLALRSTLVEYHRFHKWIPATVQGRPVPSSLASRLRLTTYHLHKGQDIAARGLIPAVKAGDAVAQTSLGLILDGVEDPEPFSEFDSYDLIRNAAASGANGRALYFLAFKETTGATGNAEAPFDFMTGLPRTLMLASARTGFVPAQLAVALQSWAERQPAGYARARTWLSAASGTPEADKYMAALLLSHPTDAAADAKKARDLAIAVTKTGYGRQDPDLWQIVAAAHSANGDFGAAVRAQREAARWARFFRWSTEEFDRRLAEYRARREVREEIVTIPTVARDIEHGGTVTL